MTLSCNRLLVLAFLLCAFASGCGPKDDPKKDTRRNILSLEYSCNRLDEIFERRYQELRKLTVERDGLTARIKADKLTDDARDDLKIQRSKLLKDAEQIVSLLETYVGREESELALLTRQSELLCLDRANKDDAEALQALDTASRDVKRAFKRLNAIKSAWNEYLEEGKFLPFKI